MLAEASKTPATAALSSISTATALGSLPQITEGRGEEAHRGRQKVREEYNLQDIHQYTKKSMEQNRHALYTCHRYTQCHLSSGQECTKHMCDIAAC